MVVHECGSEIEADLAKGALQAAGIDAMMSCGFGATGHARHTKRPRVPEVGVASGRGRQRSYRTSMRRSSYCSEGRPVPSYTGQASAGLAGVISENAVSLPESTAKSASMGQIRLVKVYTSSGATSS